MRRFSIIKLVNIYFFLTVFLCGCNSNQVVLPKHSVFEYNNQLITISKDVKSIDVYLDSGNMQLFCWDKDEIKYEAKHTIRGNEKDEKLEKLLGKYSITSEKVDSKLVLTIKYDGKIKKPQDVYTDFKLTIPRDIKELNINHQIGQLKIQDKYEGKLALKMDSVNCEVGEINGQLIAKSESGNIRLNSGKLANGSGIDVNIGNIFVKAECESQSKYSFSTEVGNIELNFPVSSNISLKSYGKVDNNQFTGIAGNIEIEAVTRMGKISVNGY